MRTPLLAAVVTPVVAMSLVVVNPAGAQATAEVTDIIINFSATDGTPLQGKLSVPASASGRVPVVFHLHGAGPRTYDNALQYRNEAGDLKVYRYYDFYARELARRGVAFFRINKRGCTSEPSGRPVVDRAVFSKATPTVLLDDYARGLDALRGRAEIDASRIVLSGASEGTRLAPELTLRSSKGIVGLALAAYAADNMHDIVVWQTSIGPWRNIQRLFPAAADGALTKAEYDAAVQSDATLGKRVPFAAVDANKDEVVTAEDMARTARPRLDALLEAVAKRDDDLLWKTLLNLSSAYLLDGWEGPPVYRRLLELSIPIAIFHGELDGTTRVEGVREAETAFREARKTNLTVRIYPDADHDLNWTIAAADKGGPAPFQDAFAFMATLVTAQPR